MTQDEVKVVEMIPQNGQQNFAMLALMSISNHISIFAQTQGQKSKRAGDHWGTSTCAHVQGPWYQGLCTGLWAQQPFTQERGGSGATQRCRATMIMYGNCKITTMLWMWLAPRAAGLVCVCVVSVVVKIEFHNLVMTELLEQILGTMYQQTLGTMYP